MTDQQLDPLAQLLAQTQTQTEDTALAAQQARAARTPPPPTVRPSAPRAAPSPAASSTERPSLGQIAGAALNVGRRLYGAKREVDKGVTAGIIRSPGLLVGSLMDFGNDTERYLGEVADSAYIRMGRDPASVRAARQRQTNEREGVSRTIRHAVFPNSQPKATWSDLLSARETLGRVGNDTVNQATAVIAASIIPAIATGGASAEASIAGYTARTIGIGAFGGGVINSPDDERISNGLQMLGVHTQFTDWLAQDDADGRFESRFKGALEGVLAEGVLEGVFHAAKGLRFLRRGNPEAAQAEMAQAHTAIGAETPEPLTVREATPQQAAQENLDRSFAQARTEEARSQQIMEAAQRRQTQAGEVTDGTAPGQGGTQPSPPAAEGTQAGPGVEELATGTRSTDAAATGQPTILEDAQAALKRIGSDEALTADNFRLTPTGRVLVSKETKRLADEAGFGRSFAEDTGIPRDEVLFATEGRTLGGPFTRGDVDAFAREVADWAARGVDDVAPSNPAGAFKLTTLGDPEDVQPVLRALVDRVPAKRTVSVDEMMEASQRIAGEVGEDPTAILAYVQGAADNLQDAYAMMGATRTMWANIAGSIERHLQVPDLAALGDDAIEAIAQDIRNATTFSGSFAQVKTGLGRGLYAARLPDADAYARALRKGLRDPEDLANAPTPKGAPDAEPMLPRTRDEIKDWLETWKALGDDPAGRAKWLERKFRLPDKNLYLRTSIANFFTANVLSKPATLMLNVVGPSVVGTVRTLEKTSGGYLGSLVHAFNPTKRAEMLATAQAAPTAYLQVFGDMQDSLRWALKAFKDNRPQIGGGGVVSNEVSSLGPVSPELLRAANAQPAWQYSMGNLINTWPRILARANAGMDEFSKRLTYFGEARTRRLVEGSTQGLRGRELNEFVREKLLEDVDLLGHSTNDDILRSAERSTFTGEIGTDDSFARRASSMINTARREYPELRFIMPVFNVPANAMGETLRRIPFLNATFKESNRELAGELGAVAQAEAYGRFVSGAALLGTGFMMSRMGVITGAGPQDPRDRAVWLQTNQPYSIKIGDQWVDYSRYDIVGAMLALPASLYDRTVNRRQDQGWQHTMYAGVAFLAEYLKERAALQTVSDFLTFSSNPTQDPQSFFDRFIGTTLGSLAVPNFIVALGRNPTDDVIRMKASTADYILDRLPFASQTLDPLRNVLGEYVHKPQDSLIEGIIPVTLSSTSGQQDPVLDEIARLYEVTGYAAGVTAPGASVGGFFDPREVKLEDGHSLWDTMSYYRSQVEIDGLTLKERLTEMFNSPEYLEEAVDADASNLLGSDERPSRGAMIAKVFAEYTREARRTVAQDSPIARRWLAVSKAKQTDDGRLRTVQAREAVERPDLLESLGVDITTFEDQITQ